MNRNLLTRIVWSLCCLLLALAPDVASAATPAQLALTGSLHSAGGAPVVSGKYGMKISLYPDAKSPAVWSETLLGVTVNGGAFSVILGATKPLDASLLVKASAAHVGVQVDNEPELPRVPLRSVPYALHAAGAAGLQCSGCVSTAQLAKGAVSGDRIATGTVSAAHIGFTYAGAKTKGGPASLALDLQCTGCVGMSELKIDGDLDLGGNALKAKQVVAGQISASAVAANSFVGDGSKLTGIQSISGSCAKKGQVVKGIAADGKLICVPSMDPSGLPPDGLDEISNGLLTNQFINNWANTTKVKISDNNPIGVVSSIDVPDVGTVQSLHVQAHVSTSDLKQLEVQVIDPKKAKHILHLKSGSGKVLKGTWPAPDKVVKGDLGAWVGANPKGKWHLKAIDSKFLNNTSDGQIESWSVQVGTLSTKKVAANGLFHAAGGFQFKIADSHPVTCSAAMFGYTYASPKDQSLYICNGKEFYPLSLSPVGTTDNPGKGCADILKKMPAAKSGLYWVATTAGSQQVFCNMADNDGGWTLVARMVGKSHCHINANKVGTLTSTGQSGCAKLSDATIRSLYTDQFWLSCGSKDPHRFGKINDIKNFNTTAKTGDKKMTWSMTYKGKTYSGTDHTCCNFGDHNYHNPHIIYSIATGYGGGNYTKDWSGCYNNQHGWHQSGYLYVR